MKGARDGRDAEQGANTDVTEQYVCMMLHSCDENRDAFLRDILKHVFCCHDILVLN